MKKIVASFAAFFLLVSAPVLFAQMPMGVPVAPAASMSFERIGVVAAAQGRVELTTPGQVGRIAQSGQPIFLGDLVTTNDKGHLQILLLDETVFTIGPSSAITIDTFIYDPKTSAGEIKASITKGVFRYVSGKIAVKNPKNVTVKLPTATLGFRGTIVGGAIESNGQGLVGLLGPGDNNDAGAQTGSFTVEGQGGDQQGVDRTGFGVEIGEGGGLSDVFQLSQDQVNGLTGGLGGGQGGSGGGGGGDSGSGLGGDNMGGLSGETGALTGDMAGLTTGLSGLTDGLNNLTTQVSQDKNNEGSTTATTLGSITNLAEMKAVTASTTFHFEQIGVLLSQNSGNYDLFVDIVFDGENSSVGGGKSRVVVNGSDTFELKQKFFSADQSSSGAFLFTDVKYSEISSMDLSLTMLNIAGGESGCIESTAIQASHDVTLKNYSGATAGTGSGTTDLETGRVEGAYTPPSIGK